MKFIRNWFLWVAWIALASFWGSLPVRAEPGNTWHLSWQALGLGQNVRLEGQIASRDLFIPVPKGLKPSQLSGVLRISPDIEDGYLEVRSRDHLLGTFRLEPGQQGKEWVIPLASAPIEGHTLPLTLKARLRSQESPCITSRIGAWIELEDPVVAFSGAPVPPQKVSEFLPPIAHTLYIFVSEPPTPAEAQAALTLAAGLQRRYRGIKPFQLTLQPWQGGRTYSQLAANPERITRAIYLRESDQNQIRVATHAPDAIPLLEIMAPASDLNNQVQWLISPWVLTAQDEVVHDLIYTPSSQNRTKQVLLADLNVSSWQVSGVGELNISVPFAQADLGGPVQDLYLRLAGNYTPPPREAQATLSLYFNESLFFAMPLDSSGAFDIYAHVPHHLLQRDNLLRVLLTYTPPSPGCALDAHPFAASLHQGSYLDLDFGASPPWQFSHLPQILVPNFQIAFTTLDLSHLDAAVQLTTSWQQLTRALLHPQVVSWNPKAETSTTPLLFLTDDPQTLQQLNAPVQLKPFRIIDATGQERFRYEKNATYGVLQIFPYQERPLIALSVTPEMDVEEIAQAVSTLPHGWYDLQGDFLLVPHEGQPVTLLTQGDGIHVEPLEPSAETLWQQWRPFIYPFLLLAILFLAAWLYPRLIRSPKQND